MRKEVFLLGIFILCITSINGWRFGNDFELKIPFLRDGPSISIDFNAKAKGGNTDELQKSLIQSMVNVRGAINDFTGNMILQTTSAIRGAFDISDKAFKDFVSFIPGINVLFNANIETKPSERNNRLPSFKFPFLPSIPNLPNILSKFNNSRVKNVFDIPDTTAFDDTNLQTNNSINLSLGSLGINLNQAINIATDRITGIFNSFKNYTNNLLKEISTISNAATIELNSTVNKLSDDLKDCVEQNGNPIEDGIVAAMNSAQDCVQNKANEVKEIVEKTLSDINAVRLSLVYLRGNLSNCQLNISLTVGSLPLISTSQAACIASALYSIQAEALTLPVGIAARATEVGSIFVSSKGYLMQCVAHFVEDISKQTTNTTLAVARCMSEKQEKQGS